MKRASRPGPTSLRLRILTFVGALIVLSVLGSTLSLYRINEVNRSLDAINRVSVPLGRLFTQMQADSEVFHRELERSLGHSHWKDPHWRPRPVPRWIEEVLDNEVQRVQKLVTTDSDWATAESKERWRSWAQEIHQGLTQLKAEASKLYSALEQNDQAQAADIYPRWNAKVEDWRRQLQWGVNEYDRALRQTFAVSQSRIVELRTGLEMILVVVVMLSLLLLWLGERALRPLNELTRLAREITRRGLRKEDKSLLPEIPLSRSDEVSQLAREFHHMATALLEREKTVELQKKSLKEQNRQLREMGELNQNILNSIESALIVTDLQGRVTQFNPIATRWLQVDDSALLNSEIQSWERLGAFFEARAFKLPKERTRLGPCTIDGRVYGAHFMPLKHENGEAYGAILALDDLTDDVELQEKLRRAENLAAVGRLSAQVAHEVRNPLHSIGLEAEMAIEVAGQTGNAPLKQSLQSILAAVDRLEKITENYLKLSRLSAGQKSRVDLTQLLETVLATYTTVCETQGIQVDWRREPEAVLAVWADADLLEQALGNLFRNALQALETGDTAGVPTIRWSLGNTESGFVWIRIEDNGPGISEAIRDRLFTPFVTTRAQGTGLGLSFVKKVIEDHGGRINFVSREGISGACFEILLPLPEQATQVDKTAGVKEFVHESSI